MDGCMDIKCVNMYFLQSDKQSKSRLKAVHYITNNKMEFLPRYNKV